MGIEWILLPLLIFMMALLYSSVGHGGASGYLAVMALLGVAPVVMKPTALSLNILVSSIALYQFYRIGAFSWRLFIPLALTALPFAFLGGAYSLPAMYYKPLVGGALLYAAWRSLVTSNLPATVRTSVPSFAVLGGLGVSLGGLSGLTGVGGGIFLSPILLFFRWAPIKVISGVSAAFILSNSISGLLGVLQSGGSIPSFLPLCLVFAGVGGWVGSKWGSQRLSNPSIQKALGLVLLIAGGKMLLESLILWLH